jgi:hypothetical protein
MILDPDFLDKWRSYGIDEKIVLNYDKESRLV